MLQNQKPLTQRLSEAGSGFGSVADVGMPMREIQRSDRIGFQEVIHGASDPAQNPDIIARLVHLSAQNPAFRERCLILIANLQPLLAQAEELEQTMLAQRQVALKTKLTEIRKLCRVQVAVVAQLNQNLASAELHLHNVAATQENAFAVLRNMKTAKDRGQHVPRWPTQAELDDWEESYAEAQQAVSDANKAAALAVQERNQAMFAIEPANNEMNRLGGEEARLKAEVNGSPYVDMELGLSSQPVGYVTAG